MKIRHLCPSDYRVMPWKSGQGSTTEIAIYPPGSSLQAGDFQWRVSSADVAASGPFSPFPGYERHLALVLGEGLKLSTAGKNVDVVRDAVATFSGDAGTNCELLNGPVRDLNLIAKKGIQSHMAITRESLSSRSLSAGVHLFFVLCGSCEVDLRQEHSFSLRAFEALLLEIEQGQQATLQLHLAPESRVALLSMG